MPRLTRAALRAEAEATQIHLDPPVDASNIALPPSPVKERAPLVEVSANPVSEEVEVKPAKTPAPKRTKSKGGRKGAKGKKGKKGELELEPDVAEEEQAVVVEDERKAAASGASEAAVAELTKMESNDVVQVPMKDEQPAKTPSRAVRMTRRQLAKAEEQEQLELAKSRNVSPSHPEETAEQSPEQIALPEEEIPELVEPTVEEKKEETSSPDQQIEEAVENAEPTTDNSYEFEQTSSPEEQTPKPVEILAEQLEHPQAIEDSAPQQLEETTEISAEETKEKRLELKTHVLEKPCEEEASPITTPTTPKSSATSPKSPMRLEESFEAIDALEEAIEEVGKAIPTVKAESKPKSPRKARLDARATLNTHAKTANADTAKKMQPAASRISRNPTTTQSLKPIKPLKPVAPAVKVLRIPSQTVEKASVPHASSVRVPSSKQPQESQKRVASGTTDYLASKRRPISLSFPTPPPPPKSARPPTKPTFQLPGEAVAAKLKAAKEARKKREEEAAKFKAEKEARLKKEQDEASKKPTFKARPVPPRKIVSTVPVKQTAASKARLAAMQGVKPSEDNKLSSFTSAAPTRSSSISTASVTKRQSTVPSSRLASSTSRPGPTAASINRLSMAVPRMSTAPRQSTVPTAAATKTTPTPAEVATQRVKGREVFNRDKLEKERIEKEKREKEEAAKRARAEAAERGRIASREWAEKQRLKKLGAAAAPKAAA
ncbi:hypothetical protein GQ43DRAFT_472706 [Delitschia confertaspora ATCC 74209]|uniref:Uncharacterized protein n=1 Tax=Delitschia confertaspora ATCC 74209 TaxID=1513339 RepID=A0A9P4MPB1_9PLEO|nr:hypothetical protein GQ43DRAFT_472706 [Delitschia confertaspora ATCC 74209]